MCTKLPSIALKDLSMNKLSEKKSYCNVGKILVSEYVQEDNSCAERGLWQPALDEAGVEAGAPPGTAGQETGGTSSYREEAEHNLVCCRG